MGKIWVAALSIVMLIGCTKVDNHNISMTFYKDGQQKQVEIEPDDQLIEETAQSGETTYKDKLERWQQVDKVPIQYQDFGQNHLYSDDKYRDTHPKQYTFKIVNNEIPQIPKKIGEQYIVDDPFFITFNSLDEGWKKYQQLTQCKVIAYGREVQKAFFSDKYQTNFAYSKEIETDVLYRYDKVEIEPNSYWVDKKVGTFKPFYYDAKPCKEVPILRSDHFKEDVKEYVEKTFRPIWLAHFEMGDATTSERTFVESARITMIPLSRRIWAIFVGSQKGKIDPFIDEIWTFSVVQFDSDKPILRAFGQKTQTDTGTWSSIGQMKIDQEWADPEYKMELYGIFDANCDGYKDFVFRWEGMGSGDEDSFRLFTISLTDKGFCEIVPEVPLYDFYGLDGEKPLFQLGSFGKGQMYSTYYQESLASHRWNKHLTKVTVMRNNGNFYLVSYKYHECIEDLVQNILSNNISYLDLGDYEMVGLTKHAQKAFLETTGWCTQEQKDIVKVLLAKNHTMFVLTEEELLPELKNHNPQ
jgi:hypothetical protein